MKMSVNGVDFNENGWKLHGLKKIVGRHCMYFSWKMDGIVKNFMENGWISMKSEGKRQYRMESM